MWVIIGQITWLHANYRHLDRFWPFLGHSGPQIPNLGVPFLANFFLQNIGMWGVQSDAMWCPVFLRPFQTEGTHSEAQNGKKVVFTAIMDPKSQFLVPHFQPIFFSLQNMGMWGVQSDAMWYPVFLQPFQTQGNPLRGSKRPKNQFYGHFGPKNPIFRLFWAAEWVPWVCHVMFGPYAIFSNSRDPISGS